MERRFELVVLSLLAASLISVGTLAGRIYETHSLHYTFLVWNLVLAWVPLVAAYFAFRRARRGIGAGVGALVIVWLLFFPNAPYVVTDFIHLGAADEGPAALWYDALMLSSFAWTALMLGFVSLYLIHALIARRASAGVGWVAVVCAFGLASIGIYLGRFAHVNSWDVVARPHLLLAVVERGTDNPMNAPTTVAALVALTVSLFIGYLVVYALSALRLERADAGPAT
ncbi:MAG TPA: DUF1361 domain-containing protein [Gaiellaceae bacterium]